jgi:hypothetical protein
MATMNGVSTCPNRSPPSLAEPVNGHPEIVPAPRVAPGDEVWLDTVGAVNGVAGHPGEPRVDRARPGIWRYQILMTHGPFEGLKLGST